MTQFVFYAHSGWRYVVILATVVAVVIVCRRLDPRRAWAWISASAWRCPSSTTSSCCWDWCSDHGCRLKLPPLSAWSTC